MIVSLLLLVGVAVAVPVPEGKRLLGTATENPIDLEKILQLINAVGKRQIEDNLWDDIVNGVESAYEWLTSPEVLSVVSAATNPLPVGKRQVEDGLWEDVVNAVVTATDFYNKAVTEELIAYYTGGKRQVEDGLWEDIVSFLVKTGEEINEAYTPIGKRQVEDGLWEDIVNAVVKASEALIENSGPALGKRQGKRLLGTATENPIDLETLLRLINAVGKRQIEDNLWDDIVNGVESAYEWLTSPEVLSVVSAATNPLPVGKRQSKRLLGTATENPIDLEKELQLINAVGKRQIEDNLWDDIVSVVTTAVDYLSSPEFALATTSYPVGKRQVKKERRLLAHLVTLVYPIFDGVGKRQA